MSSEPSRIDSKAVKLQSNQFIIDPISITKTVYGDSAEYNVDLTLQSCQCDDFVSYRSSLPIGDPRRFCRHMVEARTENLDDMHPFVQAVFQARESVNAGMPNGSSFAFFEVEGRLGFVGENRDQTAYFFVAGQGNSFHEFIYDRNGKNWIGVKPDQPAALLEFAFKERGQYGNRPKRNVPIEADPRGRQRRARARESDSSLAKYLLLALVAAGLIAGGYYLYRYLNPDVAEIAKVEKEKVPVRPDNPNPIAAVMSDDGKVDSSDLQSKADNTKPAPRPEQPKPEPDTVEDPQLETNDEIAVEFREWNSEDGEFSVSAKYKSFQNGKVTLVREDNNKEVKVDEDILSQADRDYIAAIRRERRLQKARQKTGSTN